MIKAKNLHIALAVVSVLVAVGLCASPSAGKGSRQSGGENKVLRGKARYYYLEGMRHQVEGRNAEAYENFRHSRLIDPSFEEAAYNYGQMRLIGSAGSDILMSDTELARDLSLMRSFVDAYPKDYDEVIYYAFIASRLDSLQEAIRVYERTEKLLPERSGTLLHLSDAYFAAGEDEKALDALNRYERIEGKSPNLTLKKISYLINRLDTVGAIDEASSLVASNPRQPAYLLLKGNLFNLTGKRDSVEYYFKKAEEISPGYGAAKLALADFYLEQGDSTLYDTKTYEALLAEDYGLEEKTGLLAEYLQS